MSKNIRGTLEAVALTGALIWGVWSLVPVAVGVLAAFCAVAYYGVSAFTLPAWALGIGAACAVFTAGVCLVMRGQARALLLERVVKVAWAGAALFLALGAMMAIMAFMPDLPSLNRVSADQRLNGNLLGMVDGVKTASAWLLIVGMPLVLAAIASRQVAAVHRG